MVCFLFRKSYILLALLIVSFPVIAQTKDTINISREGKSVEELNKKLLRHSKLKALNSCD